MSPVHGSNADVYGNGYVLTNFLNSATFAGARDAAESSVFKMTSKRHTPGLKDSTMALEGIYEGLADEVDDIMWQAFGDNNAEGLVSYYPYGAEVFGSPAFTIDALDNSYEVTSDIGDVCQITAEFNTGDDGTIFRGNSYLPMAARTTTGNSNSIDNDAATTLGAALIVHSTAVTGSIDVVLQDSADDAAFADIGSPISISTARQASFIVIPGTVRQFTRVRWSGTATFAAVAARLQSPAS